MQIMLLIMVLFLSLTSSSAEAATRKPNAPTRLKAVVLPSGQVRLRWADRSANEKGFTINRTKRLSNGAYRRSTNFNTRRNITEYLNNPGSGTFRYKVRAYNSAGASRFTLAFQITVKIPPPNPSSAPLSSSLGSSLGSSASVSSSAGLSSSVVVSSAGVSSASSSSEVPQNFASQLTQHSITWTFDRPYQVGQFINGDYWVVGPVVIVSVSPGWDGTRNGSMLDPLPNTAPAYDSRSYAGYDQTKLVSFPVTLTANPKPQSLVSTKSYFNYSYFCTSSGVDNQGHPCDNRGGKSTTDSAAALTVVANALPDGTFRPPYVSGAKPLFRTTQVQYASLPSLAVPTNLPIPDLTNKMIMPWLYHGTRVSGEEGIFPIADTGSPYPPNQNKIVSQMSLEILLDASIVPRKTEYTHRLIQLGIDNYSIALQNNFAWSSNGGYGVGHLWPILFAGLMLNDQAMKNPPTQDPTHGNIFKFSENGYAYYNSTGQAMFGSDECQVMYGFDAPDPRCSSNCMCRDGAGLLYPEQLQYGGSYRYIVSQHFVGEALAARLIHSATQSGKDIWNHPAFFDYVDSWTASGAANYCTTYCQNNPAECYKCPWLRDIYVYGGDGGDLLSRPNSGFMEYMWANFR